MLTKNNRFICDYCGKFCKVYDSYIPFGCSNPESPEPYDPTDLCKKCSKKLEERFIEKFNNGYRSGEWSKSKAEINAAKKCGLRWIHNTNEIVNGKERFCEYVEYNNELMKG